MKGTINGITYDILVDGELDTYLRTRVSSKRLLFTICDSNGVSLDVFNRLTREELCELADIDELIAGYHVLGIMVRHFRSGIFSMDRSGSLTKVTCLGVTTRTVFEIHCDFTYDFDAARGIMFEL